jgi:hypothetical protein
LRRVYGRRNSAVWLIGCVQGFGLAGFGAVANATSPTAIRVGVTLVVAVDLTVSWRIARTAVIVDRDRLTARSFWRTRRFVAADIANVDSPHPYGGWRGNGLRLTLTDGRTVATGVFTGTPSDPQPAASQVAELNAWLTHAHRGTLQPVSVTHATTSYPRARLAWTITLLVVCAALIALLVGLVANALIDPTFLF